MRNETPADTDCLGLAVNPIRIVVTRFLWKKLQEDRKGIPNDDQRNHRWSSAGRVVGSSAEWRDKRGGRKEDDGGREEGHVARHVLALQEASSQSVYAQVMYLCLSTTHITVSSSSI